MALDDAPTLQDIVIRLRAEADGVKKAFQDVRASAASFGNMLIGLGPAAQQAETAAGRALGGIRLNLHSLNLAGLGSIRMFDTIKEKLGMLAALAGVGLGVHQLVQWVQQGVAFNAELHKITLGIKAVVSSQFELRDAAGEAVEGEAKLAYAGQKVSAQLAKIKADSLTTIFTFEQMASTFQRMLPYAAAMNISLEDTRRLELGMLQAAAAMGLSAEHVANEMRFMSQGMVGLHTPLLRNLGLTTEMLHQWRAQGTTVTELTKKLKDYSAAGTEAGDSWHGVQSTLSDFKQQILGIAAEQIFDIWRMHLVAVRDSLGSMKVGVFELRPGIVSTAKIASEALGTMARLALAFIDTVKGIGRAVLYAASGFGAFEGAGGYVIALIGAFILLRGSIRTAVTAIQAFQVWSVVSTGATQAWGLALNSAAKEATLLGKALAWLSANPWTAAILVTIAALTLLVYWLNLRKNAEDKIIENAKKGLTKEEEEQNKINARIETAKDALAILENTASTEDQQREALEKLAEARKEFNDILAGSTAEYKKAIPFIKEYIEKEENLGKESLSRQAAAQADIKNASQIKLKAAQDRYLSLRAEEEGMQYAGWRAYKDPISGRTKLSNRSTEQIQADAAEAADVMKKEARAVAEATAKENVLSRRTTETPVKRLNEQMRKEALAQSEADIKHDAEKEASYRKETESKREANEKAFEQAKGTRYAREVEEGQARGENLQMAGRLEEDFNRKRIELRGELSIEEQKQFDQEMSFLSQSQKAKRDAAQEDINRLLRERHLWEARANEEKEIGGVSQATKLKLQAIDTDLFVKKMDQENLDRQQMTETASKYASMITEMQKKAGDFLAWRRQMNQASLQEEIDFHKRASESSTITEEKRREELLKTRELEKKLQDDRENEALGILGAINKRLDEGPLAGYTKGMRVTASNLPDLIKAYQQEGKDQLAQAQQVAAGGGITTGEGEAPGLPGALTSWPAMIKKQAELRKMGLSEKEIGGPEQLVAAAMGQGQGTTGPMTDLMDQMQQPILKQFDGLPARATSAMAKVEEAVGEATERLNARARSFESNFPDALFDGLYRRLVDKLDREFARV